MYPFIIMYPTKIDFDFASQKWRENKISTGNGCYKYKGLPKKKERRQKERRRKERHQKERRQKGQRQKKEPKKKRGRRYNLRPRASSNI